MLMSKELVFVPSKNSEQINEIYNFNVDVFTETQDFEWSKEGIKKEIKQGWSVFSAKSGKDIVAALFAKVDGDTLFTKNTPIKIDFQGNGFSHKIKEFYEQMAREKSLKRLVNYCPADNFRMIGLNESHGYTKTGNTIGQHNNLIEWEKKL